MNTTVTRSKKQFAPQVATKKISIVDKTPKKSTPPPRPQASSPYSKELVEKKSLTELKKICKETGMKHNKKKEELVMKIVNYYAPTPETEREYLETKKLIESSGLSSQPVHHQYYREEFNAVDILDRHWYKYTANYQHKHWRSKLFFCLFQVFLINSHTLYCESYSSEEMNSRKPPPKSLMVNYRNVVGLNLALFREEDIIKYDKK